MRYALLLLLATLCLSSPAASYAGCGLREGDEMWLINTRSLPSCGYYNGSFAPNYRVHKWEAGRWQRSTLEEYYASQTPTALTVTNVHGNRYEECDAIERGWQTYQLVRACETSWERVRMVVWSWPSEKTSGPLEDLRSKAARTDVEGYYLGYFLAGHEPTSQLSLMGHSFGARVVCGALHVVAGGRLRNGYLQAPPAVLPPMRALIAAAALHNYWLAQGQYFGQALSAVQSMRILYNPYDRFLIRYAILERGSKPQALGTTGPVGYLGENRQRVELYNVNPYVGMKHFQREYFENATIRRLMREHLMWREATSVPVPMADEI